MKALVSGATGFVGSHLVRRLVRDGCETHVVVRPDSSLRPLESVVGEIGVHKHDGATKSLMEIVNTVQPTIVFHLASLFVAEHKADDIVSLINSNLLFGTQLVDAMAGANVRYLINTGTSWQHFQDEDYNPVCLYAATKRAFEDILRYYVEACGIQAVTLELFDTYGPEDPRPKLLNLIRRSLITGEPLTMSAGEQRVDLVHVDDVVEAFLIGAALVTKGELARYSTFKVCSGSPIMLRDLVNHCTRISGRTIRVCWGRRLYRAREVMEPWSKGEYLPGWKPSRNLNDGLVDLMTIKSTI